MPLCIDSLQPSTNSDKLSEEGLVLRTNLRPRPVPRFVIESKRAVPRTATEPKRLVPKAVTEPRRPMPRAATEIKRAVPRAVTEPKRWYVKSRIRPLHITSRAASRLQQSRTAWKTPFGPSRSSPSAWRRALVCS